jgi:hypothetical protein
MDPLENDMWRGPKDFTQRIMLFVGKVHPHDQQILSTASVRGEFHEDGIGQG